MSTSLELLIVFAILFLVVGVMIENVPDVNAVEVKQRLEITRLSMIKNYSKALGWAREINGTNYKQGNARWYR